MRHGLPLQGVTEFRRSRSVDEPEPLSARDGVCPFLHVELGEDVPDVRLDGRGRDGKRSRDLLVDTPLRNQMEDVALTAGERFRNCASRTRSELSLIARTTQEGRCYRFRRARLKRVHMGVRWAKQISSCVHIGGGPRLLRRRARADLAIFAISHLTVGVPFSEPATPSFPVPASRSRRQVRRNQALETDMTGNLSPALADAMTARRPFLANDIEPRRQ